MKSGLVLLTVVLFLGLGNSVHGDTPSPTQAPPELNAARRTGWQLSLLIIENLEAGDPKEFPGIQAWLNDYRKIAKGIDPKVAPDRWPVLEVDALVTRNPNFWRAFYEIAPGDPGLVMLHAGLLLSAGEAVRATHLIVVASQRRGEQW